MNHGGKRTGAGCKRKIDGRVERSEKAVLKFQLREEYYNKMKHKIEMFLNKLHNRYDTMDEYKESKYFICLSILYECSLEERIEILFAYRLVYGRNFNDCQHTGAFRGIMFPLCDGVSITEEQKKLLRYYDNKRKLEYYKNV